MLRAHQTSGLTLILFTVLTLILKPDLKPNSYPNQIITLRCRQSSLKPRATAAAVVYCLWSDAQMRTMQCFVGPRVMIQI